MVPFIRLELLVIFKTMIKRRLTHLAWSSVRRLLGNWNEHLNRKSASQPQSNDSRMNNQEIRHPVASGLYAGKRCCVGLEWGVRGASLRCPIKWAILSHCFEGTQRRAKVKREDGSEKNGHPVTTWGWLMHMLERRAIVIDPRTFVHTITV